MEKKCESLQDEEFIILQGRKRRIHKIAYQAACILTLGLVYLIFKYFKKIRIFLETKECNLSEADIIVVTNQYNNLEIAQAREIELKKDIPNLKQYVKNKKIKIFVTQHTRFLYNHVLNKYVNPIIMDKKMHKLTFEELFETAMHKEANAENLEIYEKEVIYGKNETRVQHKSKQQIFIENIFSPLFLYIFLCFLLWIYIEYYTYAIVILLLATYAVVVDILRDLRKARDLKELSRKKKYVGVFRNRKWQSLESRNIVPGDLIRIDVGKDFYCDARIVKGDVIVDESFLTGETIPIAKSHANFNNRILAGTSVLKSVNEQIFYKKEKKIENLNNKDLNICKVKNVKSKKCIKSSEDEQEEAEEQEITSNDCALAIGIVTSIGYETAKGRLIRNILIPKPSNSIFYRESKIFICSLFVISLLMLVFMCLFFVKSGVYVVTAIIYATDLLTCLLAPALPTTIKIGANISAKRLKNKGITCNDLERINSAGRTDIVIFDKTGTLTEEGLDILCVDDLSSSKDDVNLLADSIVNGLSCCHSLSELEGNYVGDPLDIKMFAFSGAALGDKGGKNIYRGNKGEPVFAVNGDSEEGKVYECRVNGMKEGVRNVACTGSCTEACTGACTEAVVCSGDGHHGGVHGEVHNGVHNGVHSDNHSSDKNTHSNHTHSPHLQIVKEFEFDSNLRRMSVLVKIKDKHYAYVKGSPESLSSILCDVPEEYEETVKDYALEGYRVIAMGYKEIEDPTPLTREQAESSLTFLCFIVFANKLKKATKEALGELNEANIKVIMATGDNILTAISVGKQCNLIDKYTPIIFPVIEDTSKTIHDVQWLCVGDEELTFDKITLKLYKGRDKISYSEFYIACEGREYEFFRSTNETYFSFILSKCAIFARMNPDQKQKIVEDFSAVGYSTCFCGDGANDCGALKSAEVGVSLAQTETSVASSFTSTILDISSVITILKEGRSALVTSVYRFKFVFLTSFIQFSALALLSTCFLFMSEFQNMHNDLFVVLPLAYVMTSFQPAKKLSKMMPSSKLLSFESLCPFLGSSLIHFIFLALALFICKSDVGTPAFFNKFSDTGSMIFILSAFQNITQGIIYTKGSPFRERKSRNMYFVGLTIFLIIYNIFIANVVRRNPDGSVIKFFSSMYNLKVLGEPDKFIYLILLGIADILTIFYYEFFFAPLLVRMFKNRAEKVTDSDE